MKQNKKSDILALGMWIIILLSAFLYQPVRWFAFGLLMTLIFFIVLHKKFNGWELSVIAAFLGTILTILIWIIINVG